MNIYLIRHGKTDANLKEQYNGIIDESINDLGREDLLDKKCLYDDIKFDYAYCSPLVRTQESFKVLFPEGKIDEINKDIIEMNFGDWAERKYHDVFNELRLEGYTWDDLVNPPNGESYDELFTRTTKFLNEVIEKHQDKENILVVTHGLVIAAIMKKHYLQHINIYHLPPENGLGYVINTKTNKVRKIEKE